MTLQTQKASLLGL